VAVERVDTPFKSLGQTNNVTRFALRAAPTAAHSNASTSSRMLTLVMTSISSPLVLGLYSISSIVGSSSRGLLCN
jgi:hypothetical protein